jgi:site-specific DNA recombinase
MSGNRAAIYGRISVDREETGQKVDDQIQDCLKLAEQLDLVVDESLIFRDDNATADSTSKRFKKRAGYDQLLVAIRTGRVDVVLVTETSRLQREVRLLLDYIDACQIHDVATHTVRAGIYDLVTPSGRAVAKTKAVWDEHELEQMKQRMRATRAHKAERGEWTGNRRPFGFEADGVTVRPAEADAVRWACGQVLSGMSLSATAKALNSRGIYSSTGRPFDARTLGRMLRRPRNAGLSVHRGKVVGKAHWPALVTEVVWRGVVAVLEDPARKTTRGGPPRWLGTNLFHCHCGALVVSKSRVRPKMTVYVCTAHAHLSRNAEQADAYVRDVVLGILTKKGRGLLVPEGAHERMAELNARDAELAGKLAALGRSFAADLLDLPSMEAATVGIRAERAGITEELTSMARGSVLSGVADAPDVAKAFDACDLSRRRAIVDLLMVVTLKRSRRGRPAGWTPGSTYFDPASIEFTPR